MVLFINKGIEYWMFIESVRISSKNTSLQMNELAFRIEKGMIIICV